MKYLSAYYWQQSSRSTLVLKHLVYHKNQRNVVWGCICSGKDANDQEINRFYMGELIEWFYKEGITLCQKHMLTGGELAHSLQRKVHRLDKWLLKKGNRVPGQAGVVCVQNQFMIWGRGGVRIVLLNTSFGHAHTKLLLEESQSQMPELYTGVLESGVGILVAESCFGKYVTDESLKECLEIKELTSEKRMQKRLKELGEAAHGKEGESGAALMVLAC